MPFPDSTQGGSLWTFFPRKKFISKAIFFSPVEWGQCTTLKSEKGEAWWHTADLSIQRSRKRSSGTQGPLLWVWGQPGLLEPYLKKEDGGRKKSKGGGWGKARRVEARRNFNVIWRKSAFKTVLSFPVKAKRKQDFCTKLGHAQRDLRE